MAERGPEAVIIGSGVVDIPIAPVDSGLLAARSWPVERIAMHAGGDAVNEALALSRLGHAAALVSKVGRDPAGDFLLQTLAEGGVDTRFVRREAGLDTGINIVLVRADGERSFITSRNGGLRRLGPEDVRPALADPALGRARVACLASLFVSPPLTPAATEPLFARLKAMGLLLCADTTRPKGGETAADIAGLLARLDYFFPNYDEAAALTGREGLDDIADALLDRGVGHVAIKTGRRGCFLKSTRERHSVPAWPGARCVDTTGAGDTFAAGFIAGLLEGLDFADCGRLANAAASLCVEAVGAAAGLRDRAAVDARFRQIPRPTD